MHFVSQRSTRDDQNRPEPATRETRDVLVAPSSFVLGSVYCIDAFLVLVEAERLRFESESRILSTAQYRKEADLFFFLRVTGSAKESDTRHEVRARSHILVLQLLRPKWLQRGFTSTVLTPAGTNGRFVHPQSTEYAILLLVTELARLSSQESWRETINDVG